MGSIADKLTYLNGTKTAIKNAIVAKGVEVADTDTFRDYADKISTIEDKKYGIHINGMLGDVDENGVLQFPTASAYLDLSAVKQIPTYGLWYKFNHCQGIKSVTIGLEGVTSANHGMERCWFNNTSLTSVSFPKLTGMNGTSALTYAFSGCTNLTSISFPVLNSVGGTSNMNYAFYGCTSLENVSFPNLSSLSGSNALSNAFSGCTNLTSISFPVLESVMGASAMSNTFADCTNLASVSFPNLTRIDGSNRFNITFKNCTSLTSISFPSLTDITPSGTLSQFNNTFQGCTNLLDIYFRSDIQERVEELNGYSTKWGASNATIHFTDEFPE